MPMPIKYYKEYINKLKSSKHISISALKKKNSHDQLSIPLIQNISNFQIIHLNNYTIN